MSTRTRLELVWTGLLALGCMALLFVFFSPCWGAFLAWSHNPDLSWLQDVRRGASVLFQVDNLGQAIPDELHGAIQWRLLFPLMAHTLGLSAPVLFGVSHLGCVLALGFAITVMRRNNLGWLDCALAAAVLVSASWAMTSVRWLGYFDAWVVYALFLVGFSPSRWVVGIACVWAPWVDERFVIGLPLALACGWVRRRQLPLERDRPYNWMLDAAGPLGIVAAFVAVRLGVLGGVSGNNATISGYFTSIVVGRAPWARLALGVWEGLRAGWCFVILAIGLSWPRRLDALVLGSIALVVAAVVLATAQDFSRSMMFIAPQALLGIVFLARAKPGWGTPALGIAAMAAFFLPAHVVTNNAVIPVFGLQHELEALHRTPRELRYVLHELSAIKAEERGEYDLALTHFSAAMELAPYSNRAVKLRGDLHVKMESWKEAHRDYSALIELTPAQPEAWFLRARTSFALGHFAAARVDLSRATTLGGERWASLPAVQQLAEQLRGKRDQ